MPDQHGQALCGGALLHRPAAGLFPAGRQPSNRGEAWSSHLMHFGPQNQPANHFHVAPSLWTWKYPTRMSQLACLPLLQYLNPVCAWDILPFNPCLHPVLFGLIWKYRRYHCERSWNFWGTYHPAPRKVYCLGGHS